MNASINQTESLLFIVLTQLIVMVGAARCMHTVFRRIGQPGVIGEILAGLLLGPSLMGHFFPQASHALFGEHASVPITIISQIGLILLMFQIGTDFEFAHLGTRRNRRVTAIVTIFSVGVPLAVGISLGHLSASALAPAIDPVRYSLFFGLGLAITAVPVLGRILRQYGLTQTEVGVVAISAAAINDVIGWLLLSAVSAYAASRFSAAHEILQFAGLFAFSAVLWFVLRPLVSRLVARFPARAGELSPNLMAIVICLIFALGIFTYTGLRTNVLGLSTSTDWQWLAIILAAAALSKIVPVYFVGRICGFDRNESSILGTLMNTRGLMELIVLNIGFDLGLIPQKVFTMLVIMAVVTTLMAGPLLKRLLSNSGHCIPAGLEA
jgi:Kef-type K+ transport system membrane component KefB